MARLADPDVLAGYQKELCEWTIEGYVELQGRALEGLRSAVVGVTAKEFKAALYCYVFEENGEIDRIKEEREQWREIWEWHYDLRPTINCVKLHVETRPYPE